MLPKLLEDMSEIEEKQKREKCIKIYNHFKNNFINKLI